MMQKYINRLFIQSFITNVQEWMDIWLLKLNLLSYDVTFLPA